MKSNVECFDYCVLIIANELYHRFPICGDLEPYELIKNDNLIARCGVGKKSQNQSGAEISNQERLVTIMGQTLFWLQENGFLDYNSEPEHRDYSVLSVYSCVRLTAKGLLVLKSTPDSLKGAVTLGEHIGKTLRESADNMLRESTTRAVMMVVGALSSL